MKKGTTAKSTQMRTKKKDKNDIPIKQVKVGRPSKFDKSIPAKAKALAKEGARDKDIAKSLHVSEATLNIWKRKYPEFLESLREGKDTVDKKVECSLLKCALGYSVFETKRSYRPLFKPNGEPVLDDQGNQIKALLREEVTEREIPASYSACFFWLKNRKSDVWRDNRLMDTDKEKGEVIDLLNRMKAEDA
jgi:hypothetical protein